MLQFKSIDNTKIHMIKELNDPFLNNPSFILITLAIVVVILWLIVKHYSVAYSNRLGDIDAKIESIAKVVDIEKAVTKAVKAIDHSYWQKQQVDDVRRKKLEQVMLLLIREVQEICIGFTEMKTLEDYHKKTLFTGHVGTLTQLYFPEVLLTLSKYEKSKKIYLNKLVKKSNDISSYKNIVIKNNGQLYGDLKELGKGLTFHQ